MAKRIPNKPVFQSKISVQDIATNATLADVINIENKEMRRLALAIEKAVPTAEPGIKTTTKIISPDSPTTPKVSEWATAYYKNDNKVVGNDVQLINFKDTDTVQFVLEQVQGAKLKSNSINNPQQVNIKANVKGQEIQYGLVYLNQLPLDPATMPPGTPTGDLYKYEGYYITPDYGYYGWYVYGLIEHNWGLSNKDKFTLNLVDIHDFDTDDLDAIETLMYESRFNLQTAMYPAEGLDSNNIIIVGKYKPDINYLYRGTYLEQSLDFIDEPNRIIRTNLIFYYVLTKGE